MELTVIGTGTAAPEPDRVCAGFLLQTGSLKLLLDCGPGVVHNMARLHADWRGITHLLLTHFHNDHIGDVPMLFFAWRHGMRPARSEPLTVVGPKGTKKLLAKMGELFGAHVAEPAFDMEVHELEESESLRLDDVATLKVCPTAHTDASLAFRTEAGTRSFCYTGDTGMSERIAKFAMGVDLLVIECSVPEEEEMPTHLTPAQVAAMARIALPRRLLLTHIYPQLERALVPELVRAGGWPARVEIAADGERFEI